MAIDYNAKLLLHLNDDWTDSSTYGHDVDTVSGATISTAVKKFGAGSGYFDGTNDFATINDSDDFDFGTGDFTIEFQLYLVTSCALYDVFLSKITPNSWTSGWNFSWSTNGVAFFCPWGTAAYGSAAQWTWLTETWYHVAVVRYGTTVTMYRNGTAGSNPATKSTSIDTNYAIQIGWDGYGYYPNINIDEIRISNVARYTSNFTPPTAEFDIGSEGGLLIHPGMGGGMRSLCGGFRA